MMAAAKVIASDLTQEISPEMVRSLRPPEPTSGDPVDELVLRVRGRTEQAVDPLQVAAVIEADGVNDRAARVEYGYVDVFTLAEEIYRRLGGSVPKLRGVRNENPEPKRWRRDVAHGLLYLLPGALFPAVLAVVRPQPFVVALVAAGLLGWVWAGAATWLAYQWLNVHDARGAGRVLVWTSLTGVVVGAGVGAAIGLIAHSGPTAAVLVPAVMTYQMGATMLLFYRRELWVALLMGPAAAAGVWYMVVGPRVLDWALGAITAGVVIAFGLGLQQALRAGGKARHLKRAGGPRIVLKGQSGTMFAVVAYNTLTAAFLLHAQAPYLLKEIDIVLASTPMIVAMGVVEWRARRFVERSRWLLSQVRYPREFARRVWLMLAFGTVMCWLAVALVAAPVLGALYHYHRLTWAGVAMAGAQVALAGAYFLAFILAGHYRYGTLSLALAVAITAHVVAAQLLYPVANHWFHWSPAADMALFGASAVLLQLLLLAALGPILGQARRYR
jgi:hypothetical protein